MPLVVHNALDAVRIRKSNPVAAWGNRVEENRIEPVTKPQFDTPFKLKRKERIFTIGSCFARNVEKELMARGYRIPMRDLLEKPGFEGVEAEIVNNFGAPSIYNELAWAFGTETFDEELGFVEVQDGKFVDLHMINSIRPAPIELLRKRRAGLGEVTRLLKKCRVLIMTLGLVELWWDNEAKIYLNTAPLPSIIKKWPGRFELHVLTFEECRDYLERALDLCFDHGHRNLQIILTVSPVPMALTHRRMDVVTANSYSKSVLRTVAEHVVSSRDGLCYYPSYESVTHSDRHIAWTDDFVHVTKDIVAFNVERMVNAFAGTSAGGAEQALPQQSELPNESVEALVLAERAVQARMQNDADFFADHANQAKDSPAFRLEYARFLNDRDEHDAVIALLSDDNRTDAVLVRVQAHLKLKENHKAIEAAMLLAADPPKGDLYWRIQVEAATAMRSTEHLYDIERRWIEHKPRHISLAKFWIGRALRIIENYEPAIARLKDAEISGERTPMITAELARSLIGNGQAEAALELLDGAPIDNERHLATVNRLKIAAQQIMKKAD